MKELNVLELIANYKSWVEKGEIQFLPKSSPGQTKVLSILGDLSSDFEKATQKGSLSKHLDWREAHKKGLNLWRYLASFSLNSIDKNSKGNSALFDYLGSATRFEDLLYGLEPYYRDHTLHSLWVYFIGEHLLRDHLPEMYNNLNWYLYNDIEHDKDSHSRELRNESIKKEKEISNQVNKHKDAIWCMIALCHDLGYSLSKLNKLNEHIVEVLKHFQIPNYKRTGYSLDIEHQYITSQFLDLMSIDVRIVPSVDKKDVLIKCYRDDSTYWRLCRAFEAKQHGVLSSYLLYKILGIFAESWMRGSAEEWGLDDREAFDNILRGDILFAIAQHEFDFAHLNQIESLADILIISDELEEFSRFGRQLSSRSYHDTTAKASVNFAKKGKHIDLDMTYQVDPHQPLKEFFKIKAEKLCRIYSLDQDVDEYSTIAKSYTINSIKMQAIKDSRTCYVKIYRASEKDRIFLPTSKIDNRTYRQREYPFKCYDDKIMVYLDDDKECPLSDWFENSID